MQFFEFSLQDSTSCATFLPSLLLINACGIMLVLLAMNHDEISTTLCISSLYYVLGRVVRQFSCPTIEGIIHLLVDVLWKLTATSYFPLVLLLPKTISDGVFRRFSSQKIKTATVKHADSKKKFARNKSGSCFLVPFNFLSKSLKIT